MAEESKAEATKRMVGPKDAQHVAGNLYNVLGFAYSIAPHLDAEAWSHAELQDQLENVHKEIATAITVLCWACEERDIDSSPLAILATRWQTLWREFPDVRQAFAHIREVIDEQESIDLLSRTCHRLLRKVELEVPDGDMGDAGASVDLNPKLLVAVEDVRPGLEIQVRREAMGVVMQTATIRGSSLVPFFLGARERSVGLGPTGRVSWKDLREEFCSRKGWKGRIPGEATMKKYASRIRQILTDAGLGDLWQVTSHRGARFGPV